MDHPWRPPLIQGTNICPTCSFSHFPFCPPHPHPGPTFDPGRPVFDHGYWPNNPNGNSYHGFNDDHRSSKRLRVGGESEVYFSRPAAGGGPNSGFGFDGGLGFGRIFEGRERGGVSSNVGGSVDYRHGYGVDRSVSDVGSNVRNYDYERGRYENVAVGPDHGSFRHGGSGFVTDRQYYGGYRPNCGVSFESLPSNNNAVMNYEQNGSMAVSNRGVNFESLPSNNAAMHYEQNGNMLVSSRGNNFENLPSNNAAMNYEQNGSMLPVSNQYPGSNTLFPAAAPQLGHTGYNHHSPHQFSAVRQPLDTRPRPVEGYQGPYGNPNIPPQTRFGPPHMDKQGGFDMGHVRNPQGFEMPPPLPASPPPPLPREPPPVHWSVEQRPPSPLPKASSSLFPVSVSSSGSVHPSHAPIPESHGRANSRLHNPQIGHAPRGGYQGESQGTMTTLGQYPGGHQHIPLRNNIPDKPKTVDAAHLFRPPHRTSRADHFVIILRGLPGSGKSYLAKMLRDLEVEHGGSAPRIHSMDDYFMTEVEKTEEIEASQSSVRGKKPTTKTVLEFCYEPEMEEAYRSSMLKAYKKTLEEGVFTFVIVDDRNLRVADFAQFWATAKRSGFEAYVLEAPYKDPAGCAARNVHGFTQDDVEKMASQWEEAPSLYLQLDVKSLFHGDDLNESNIQEVDMDTEDDFDGNSSNLEERHAEKTSSAGNLGPEVLLKDEKNLDADVGNPPEQVKGLGRSKWSGNLDDDDERTEVLKRKVNALSGLLGTYGKAGKSVHWGDQGGHTGFSIGAVKKANVASLVIGPGAGYNLKSNPLPEDTTGNSGELKKHSVFQERMRAERESFRAVFDRRRHRIGGLLAEED